MIGKRKMQDRLNYWRYLGYSKEVLALYDSRVAADNLQILSGALAVAVSVILLELAVVNLGVIRMAGTANVVSLRSSAKVLIMAAVVCSAMLLVTKGVRRRQPMPFYSRILTTLFLFIWVLTYNMIGTVLYPQDCAVIACGMLLLVQVVFDSYPLENLAFATFAYLLFITMSFLVKPFEIFIYDIFNAMLFYLIGGFLSWIKSRSKWSALIHADAMVQFETQKLENELTQFRIVVMLSQIQPHFLYNALSSIQCLCRDDPAAAEKATADFSMFLRGNMDSLTMDKPIGFAKELEHTKHYLSLEKLRFPDKLHVVYDIRTTLFHLPTLTLQPIVENAVRYGVTKTKVGGTVKISTRETDTAFVLTVEDNGAGFDPMKHHDDGRTHIGIQNVRDRLARMSGGTLTVESTRGVGTVAVITIPKGETP
ncbi:sensor histidine kinase [Anaerotruncus rubiinfantis]|uniref:sensor histidine kinase n=1 Tax=Anaerotruncus rubiinfantis TaxID=1720200 RepID=UPI0018980C08|nr:histidine kinase [Anaerotruncus rubiinfantis]